MASDIRHEIVALLPRRRRFARALTRSADQADDLVQGACERALRSLHTWQPGSRLDSWMFRILRNLWIDGLKRHRTELAVEAEDTPELAGEDGRRTMEGRFELARVQAAIAALPEGQREVLVLTCIEDMSYREVADILDIPIGTVMSRLSRARLALAQPAAGRNERRSRGGPI